MSDNQHTLPGTHIVNGVEYLNGAKGNLTRVDSLSAKDKLLQEHIYKMVRHAQVLAAQIARFKSYTFDDIDALDALLDQEYGVTSKSVKGNRAFTSPDGQYRVSIRINTPEEIGPELQQAKALIDEIVLEKGAAADPVLAQLVAQVFDVGKAGRVNTDLLRRLKKLEIDDPRWPRIQKAIGDAITDGVSKSYVVFHRWDGSTKGWKMIPLDLAAIEVTPDAFEYPSARREVEDLKTRRDQAADMLARAIARADDGQADIAVDLIRCAKDILDGLVTRQSQAPGEVIQAAE